MVAVEEGALLPSVLPNMKNWRVRTAARCVITNGQQIAMQRLETEDATKLPGGGVQHGEDDSRALERELLEEIGVSGVSDIDPLGVVFEFRRSWRLVQISRIFQARIGPESWIGPATEEGSSLTWGESPSAAVGILEASIVPDTYDKRFMLVRDREIMRHFISTQVSMPGSAT